MRSRKMSDTVRSSSRAYLFSALCSPGSISILSRWPPTFFSRGAIAAGGESEGALASSSKKFSPNGLRVFSVATSPSPLFA